MISSNPSWLWGAGIWARAGTSHSKTLAAPPVASGSATKRTVRAPTLIGSFGTGRLLGREVKGLYVPDGTLVK
jgi:hypothetical protein